MNSICYMQIHKTQGAKKDDGKDNGKESSDSSKGDKDDVDYGKAGAIAEEVLSAIHIVTSFGGQNEIVDWYVYVY